MLQPDRPTTEFPAAVLGLTGGEGDRRGTVRVSIAGPCCCRPGDRSRLISRPCSTVAVQANRKGSAGRS
ncbi:hypothetical protein OG689_29360 [Kitasatospora sp. NBC_00240]|uniref:hypothetical protein n=1 Tax=Kitasatospora sp. NBC_00240 TaxID=2903567 RepID=UPI0022597165|nr:hypothetical protein [Kitasatospora sp. NBC_00240]MCX5213325.1 hypothetical protein [Kitasatospora sp. NBC_00240]